MKNYKLPTELTISTKRIKEILTTKNNKIPSSMVKKFILQRIFYVKGMEYEYKYNDYNNVFFEMDTGSYLFADTFISSGGVEDMINDNELIFVGFTKHQGNPALAFKVNIDTEEMQAWLVEQNNLKY